MKQLMPILIITSFFTVCFSGRILSRSIVETSKLSKVNKDDESAPKSYNDSSITDEERKFIKEIEERFNVKNEDNKIKNEKKGEKTLKHLNEEPPPAVIAIEIFNDSATENKGKRTIDANLGYGYKTNNGYFYTRFGNPPKEMGKFMIYPYSQHDIVPNPHVHKSPYQYHTQVVLTNKNKKEKTHVEILPSKAYQLVPIEEDENAYNPEVSQLQNNYEHVQAVQTPPPPQYHKEHPTTLYTTYSGGQISGFTGHFPLVMSNYYVSPSQFLSYQGANTPHPGGNEHLIQRNIIPVIILRIPSSQIQTPTAEFYPKLPNSSPYATTLNNIDIPSLVNQYLTNLHSHYETPPNLKYTLHYERPMAYYDPHQTYYMIPNHQNQQVVHQNHYQTTNTEHENRVQYSTDPHNIPAPTVQSAYSNIYAQANGHQEYEEVQNTDEALPFSENYPDSAHTQVIYKPHYQNGGRVPSGYATPASNVKPVHHEPLIRYVEQANVASQNQIDAYDENSENVHEENNQNEESEDSPQIVYNYHAHPFPKRQIKPSDEQLNKTTMVHRTRSNERKTM